MMRFRFLRFSLRGEQDDENNQENSQQNQPCDHEFLAFWQPMRRGTQWLFARRLNVDFVVEICRPVERPHNDRWLVSLFLEKAVWVDQIILAFCWVKHNSDQNVLWTAAAGVLQPKLIGCADTKAARFSGSPVQFFPVISSSDLPFEGQKLLTQRD